MRFTALTLTFEFKHDLVVIGALEFSCDDDDDDDNDDTDSIAKQEQ